MSNRKNRPAPGIPSSELWLIRACLTVALGISIFLAWSSFAGGGVPGCGPESACDKVLSSRWGYVFGLPVSVFALPVYAALLALLRPANSRWRFIMPLAFLVLASALWFVGVQAFALRAFCKFCMTAHAAGIFAALLLLRRAELPFPKLLTSAGLACLAAASLVAAQVLAPERTAKQVAYAPAPVPSPPPAPPVLPQAAPPVTNSPAPAPTFKIIAGEFTLDLTKVPVAGPVNAPRKVAKLFDYTCHHCRDLHHLLSEFRAKHSNELAVVSLPLPLDSECNPIVKKTANAHVNSCQYAKFGLAVFQADPSKFEDYTDWIFANPRPPELSQAREYAARLVGAEKFETAVESPVVAEQIRLDIDIYRTAYKKSRSGQLPQMYFEQGAAIGAVATREALEKIMADNLGIVGPSVELKPVEQIR